VEKVQFERTVVNPFDSVIQDYFESGEASEVASSLEELAMADRHNEFVRRLISTALEKPAFERELTSQLLSTLYGKSLTVEKLEEGFQELLNRVDDLVLDSPDAVDTLSKFLSRAVMDEIVPPKFLSEARSSGKRADEVLALAVALTTERFRGERLAHVWGPGGLSSVKRLKEETHTLLEEFLTSGDSEEADQCVRRFNAPSFHFQLVKIAVRLAVQRSDEDKARLSKLLNFFCSEGLVAPGSIERGFKACFESLNDIALDVPSAGAALRRVTELAVGDGYLPPVFLESL